jgi:cell cycle sensor histidine kinase DivJ
VIGNCCDILALKARECGLDLTMRLPGNLPQITADKRAFKQILLNLISNAVKFTERGGRVTVTAAIEGSDMLVVVEDNGVGISSEDLPRVGRPFFQARGAYDRRHDGTGLGLSIVQGLVGLHGGEMRIESRLREGTRVTVRLPIDCEAARPALKPANVAHPSFDRVVEAVEALIKKTA